MAANPFEEALNAQQSPQPATAETIDPFQAALEEQHATQGTPTGLNPMEPEKEMGLVESVGSGLGISAPPLHHKTRELLEINPELDLNPAEQALVGTGRGFVRLGQETNLLIKDLAGIFSDSAKADAEKTRERYNRETKEYELMTREKPIARALGNVLPIAGEAAIPGGLGYKAGRALGASALGAEALGGAAAGAFVDPGTEGSRAVGGVVGGALGGLGAKLGTPKVTINKPFSQAQANDAVAQSMGINLTVGQRAGQDSFISGVERKLADVPVVGTGKAFEKQQDQLSTAISDYMRSTMPKGLKADEPRAMAQSLVDNLNEGINKIRSEGSKMYDQFVIPADQMAIKKGLINLEETKAAATNQQAKLAQSIYADRPETKELVKMLELVKTKEALLPSEVHELRKTFDSFTNQINKQVLKHNSPMEHKVAIQGIRDSLENELQSFAQSNGLDQPYNAAKQFWKNEVVPLTSAPFSKATKPGTDADTVFNMLVKSDRPELASKLMKAMPEQGKDLVRYRVMKSAFDDAVDSQTGKLDTMKWTKNMDKLGTTNQMIFSKSQQEALDGMKHIANIVNPTKGSGMSLAGKAVAGSIAATSALSSPLTATGAAAITYVVSQMLTSKAGIKVLESIGRGSKLAAQSGKRALSSKDREALKGYQKAMSYITNNVPSVMSSHLLSNEDKEANAQQGNPPQSR